LAGRPLAGLAPIGHDADAGLSGQDALTRLDTPSLTK